jgi:hypothetical protein
MGVRFSRAAILQDWEGRLHQIPAVVAEADRQLERIAEEGAEEMRGYISTRGTSWSNAQGRAGRIDSGAMLDAVQSRPNPNRSNRVFSWEFGWVEKFLDYFRFQEEGFTHVGGNSVEPMFALRDASSTARDKMVVLGPKILRDLKNLIERGRA